MPIATPFRAVISSIFKAAAALVGVMAVIAFFYGGRALHDFASLSRIFGEGVGLVAALILCMIALFLKAFGERIEDRDDGEPVSLSIGAAKENEQPR